MKMIVRFVASFFALGGITSVHADHPSWENRSGADLEDLKGKVEALIKEGVLVKTPNGALVPSLEFINELKERGILQEKPNLAGHECKGGGGRQCNGPEK